MSISMCELVDELTKELEELIETEIFRQPDPEYDAFMRAQAIPLEKNWFVTVDNVAGYSPTTTIIRLKDASYVKKYHVLIGRNEELMLVLKVDGNEIEVERDYLRENRNVVILDGDELEIAHND